MIYQKCEKCGSEWNAIKNMQECPFCGNLFEIQTSNFKNIEDAFKYIFNSRGLEIIKHKKEFLSLLADYAPTLEKERRAIGIVLDSGVYLELLAVDKNDIASQNNAKAKAVGKLNTEFWMDSTQASYAVSWFISQLGWNSSSTVQSEKKFVPCDTSSSTIDGNEATQIYKQNGNVDRSSFPKIVIGEKTSFGNYAYEGDGTPKPIEWEIINVQNDKILLWATKCLDVYPYNFKRDTKCDWNHSELRKYIRENIFIKAFNDLEKTAIITNETSPSCNPNSQRCDGKEETFDKVFILSNEEFEQYQLSPFQLKGAATPFAKKAGVFCTADGDAYYWVRTPGSGDDTQMFIGKGGQRDVGGNYVDIKSRGIRPAVWVDYDKFFRLKNGALRQR